MSEIRPYARRCPICCGITDSDGVGVTHMDDAALHCFRLAEALDQAARDLHRAGFTGEAREARAALPLPKEVDR